MRRVIPAGVPPLCLLFTLVGGVGACGPAEESPTPAASAPEPSEDWGRDLLTTEVIIDLADPAAPVGVAHVTVAPSDTGTGLSLEAAGLDVQAVTTDGGSLRWERDLSDGSIDIGLPEGASAFTVEYTLTRMDYTFDGYMISGDTFIWPDYCSNLFPCHSDPADGLRFSVEVLNPPAGSTVVAPTELLPLDAPSYQLGFAVGDYTRHDLGTTTAGTKVVFYSLSTDSAEDIEAGTASFKDYVDTLESYLGPYPFGAETGAKSVRWCEEGGCAYAGMEEHPYFDVSDGSVNDPTVFSHEAAHAWFGDGIRLECWGEDLVFSEGTASYLEIAVIGLVDGEEAANADITYYEEWLAESQLTGDDHVVWPDSCDAVDTYDIWYSVTYSRGALFWIEVEKAVGREVLLSALGDFTAERLGGTASMGELLDAVHTSTGFDPWPLAEGWLRSTAMP